MAENNNILKVDLEEMRKTSISKAFDKGPKNPGQPKLPGGLPEGTIKDWKGGKFIKRGGQWVPYTEGKQTKKPEAIKPEKGKKPEEQKQPGKKTEPGKQSKGAKIGDYALKIVQQDKIGIRPTSRKLAGEIVNEIANATFGIDNFQREDKEAYKEAVDYLFNTYNGKTSKEGETGKGAAKSPEDHAKGTSTEDLKKYIEKPDADPKLKKVAETELKNRMGGGENQGQGKEEGKKGDSYQFNERLSTSENIREETKFNRAKQQKHIEYVKKTLDNLPHMSADKKQFMTDEILSHIDKITDKATADSEILNALKKWEKTEGNDITAASQIEGAHPKAVERYVKQVFGKPNSGENADQYIIRTFDLGIPGMMMEDVGGMRYKFLGNDKDGNPMYVNMDGEFFANGTKGYDKVKSIQDAYKDNIYLPKNSAKEVYDSVTEQLMDPDILSDYYSIEDGMIWDRMESNYIDVGSDTNSAKEAIKYLCSQDFIGSVDYGYDIYSQLNVTRERTDWALGDWIEANHPKLMDQMVKSFKKWMKDSNENYY